MNKSYRFLGKKRPIYGWKWLKTEICSRILIKFDEVLQLPCQSQIPANLITGIINCFGRFINLSRLNPSYFLPFRLGITPPAQYCFTFNFNTSLLHAHVLFFFWLSFASILLHSCYYFSFFFISVLVFIVPLLLFYFYPIFSICFSLISAILHPLNI